VAPTTTIFLIGFVVILMMCLQFSWVISTHRRQIKRLTQRLAVLERERSETSRSAVSTASDCGKA
jgi:uncharacterized membrane protein YciS (DUF1049 family)